MDAALRSKREQVEEYAKKDWSSRRRSRARSVDSPPKTRWPVGVNSRLRFVNFSRMSESCERKPTGETKRRYLPEKNPNRMPLLSTPPGTAGETEYA